MLNNNELSVEAAFSRWIKGEPVEYLIAPGMPWSILTQTDHPGVKWWKTRHAFRVPSVPLTLPEAVKIAAERAKAEARCSPRERG